MSMCSYAHAGRADEHAFMNSAHLLIAQNCTRYDHDFENLTNSDSSIGRTRDCKTSLGRRIEPVSEDFFLKNVRTVRTGRTTMYDVRYEMYVLVYCMMSSLNVKSDKNRMNIQHCTLQYNTIQ